jgi:hypothetical protein
MSKKKRHPAPEVKTFYAHIYQHNGEASFLSSSSTLRAPLLGET